LHELGHILGLEHTNMAVMDCPGVAGNDPTGNTGVMRTTNSSFLPLYRHWRRDDLDGLDFLWGPHAPDYEVAYWDDSTFPAAPVLASATPLTGMSIIRSPSLADAEPGGLQPVVSVDPSHRVMLATVAADGSISEPAAPVDPGPLGTTVGSPSVAVGSDESDDRVFVTWTAAEESTSETMSARWGLRDLSGGVWTHGNAFELRTSRLTAGFDPGTRTWLMASLSLDSELSVSVLDYDGALLLEQAPLGITAYDHGNPICGHGSGPCTMLISDTELGGPNLARVDFGVSISPPAIAVQQSSFFDGQDVYGRLALARAGFQTLRGVGGWYRFELGTAPEAGLDPAMPPASVFRSWPLAIGAKDGLHRLGYPVEIVCGDGYLQGSEECDDGNLLPGDGCDSACSIEEMGAETGTETGTGEGGLLEDTGCHCSGIEAGRNLSTTLLAPFALLVLGGPRRRWSPAPRQGGQTACGGSSKTSRSPARDPRASPRPAAPSRG
jgi:cysteine-rich repeat protein